MSGERERMAPAADGGAWEVPATCCGRCDGCGADRCICVCGGGGPGVECIDGWDDDAPREDGG